LAKIPEHPTFQLQPNNPTRLYSAESVKELIRISENKKTLSIGQYKRSPAHVHKKVDPEYIFDIK